MKNSIIAGLFIFLLLLVISCSKDVEDKLEGKWQLQHIEADGITQKVDTVFYNFQTSLFQYQILNPATNTTRHIYGFKTLQGEKQLLLEMSYPPANVNDFISLTDWASPERMFVIEDVTSSRLVISSEDKLYTFRKF